VSSVERSDSGVYLSTVCLSVCLLVHHLGDDLVQQSDGGVCLPICVSVCLSLLGTSFRWWSGRAVTPWCLSVFVSVSLCMLGNHLGGGPVERSDSYVCLSVCLSVCWVHNLGGGLVEQSDNDVCLFVCQCVLDALFRWWSCRAVR